MNDRLLALAEHCVLCPRQCGVNRLAGARGFCGASSELLVSYIGLHHGEEPPISGTRGSGTVFFGHCTLACVFCQNYQISQPEAAAPLRALTAEELAAEFLQLQAQKAHNINLVSPTQYAPWIAQALDTARQNGLTIPVVYNTNGYENAAVLALLTDYVDIYLPDLKYADDAAAQKFSSATGYTAHNLTALQTMLAQKGPLQLQDTIAVRGLLVRHLVLPGLAAESKKILDWLYTIDPQLHISLMAQYAPQHKASAWPPLNRQLTAEEYTAVVDHAAKLGLENVWIQELDSQDILVPDFTETNPFARII